MKLLDYIRGLRKGKEAHRLEKESMQDPFLADAMDGYNQVEGNHEQRIEKLRMQVSAHSAKKKNTYAITWSIAACLVIGFGISSYFLFLKKSMTDEVFIAEECVPAKLPEAATPATPTNPAVPAIPITPTTPRKEIAQAATKVKTDSAPIPEIAVKQADKKEMSASAVIEPVVEEALEQTAALQGIVVTMDTSKSDSDKKMRMAKVATIPNSNIIQGKVTDEKGEPIIGASVAYKGTNIGTITNMNGEFSLVKKEGEKRLTAQFIGYDPVEIPVDSSQTMLIAMNENKQTLNEVAVVGYGTNKNKKSTTLGTVVTAKEQADKHITPQPVIGKRKYQKYLKENLVRPTDEKCAQVKGKVVLTFLVNKEGRPFYIKVKEGLCESFDKEAIRLIQEGPDWIYGNKAVEITVKFE